MNLIGYPRDALVQCGAEGMGWPPALLLQRRCKPRASIPQWPPVHPQIPFRGGCVVKRSSTLSHEKQEGLR